MVKIRGPRSSAVAASEYRPGRDVFRHVIQRLGPGVTDLGAQPPRKPSPELHLQRLIIDDAHLWSNAQANSVWIEERFA